MHFYILFGTNLLTEGQCKFLFFCPFQCFEANEYQTESKRDETFGSDLFGTNANQETWSGRQAANEAATRVPNAPPTFVGPSWLNRPTSSSYIYPRTPEHPGAPQKPISTTATFCIREIPSWSLRRCSTGGGIDHGWPLHHLQGLSGEL